MEMHGAQPSARGAVVFWALAGLALLISHNATFLVQLGPGQSLARIFRDTGHEYWGIPSLALLGIALAAAILALFRLSQLRRRAIELAARLRPLDGRKYIARAAHYWVRLLAVVAIAFLVQENLEHLDTHRHLPVLGVLIGPEYPLALPVIGLVTLVGGLIGAAVGVVEQALVAVIAAALGRALGRAPRCLPRPPLRQSVTRISLIAQAIAGRAPPRTFVPHN